jgi:hypothetical protein
MVAASNSIRLAEPMPVIDDCGNVFPNSDGYAVCNSEKHGEKIVAGAITNVDCCFCWSDGNCEACNDDARSQYYGQLGDESCSDPCFYGEIDGGGIGWSCYADDVTCQLT